MDASFSTMILNSNLTNKYKVLFTKSVDVSFETLENYKNEFFNNDVFLQ